MRDVVAPMIVGVGVVALIVAVVATATIAGSPAATTFAAPAPSRWEVRYSDHSLPRSTLLTGMEIMQVDDMCLLITYSNGDHQALVVDQKYCQKQKG